MTGTRLGKPRFNFPGHALPNHALLAASGVNLNAGEISGMGIAAPVGHPKHKNRGQVDLHARPIHPGLTEATKIRRLGRSVQNLTNQTARSSSDPTRNINRPASQERDF